MKYMGSKNRIAKYILPIILKDRKPNQWYVEPFAGGMNVIDKVDGNRIANDNNKYLIEMWKGLINNTDRINDIPKSFYSEVRDCFNGKNDNFNDFIVGWIGFMGSANGRFFEGGYSGKSKTKIGTERDYIAESIRNIEKQIPNMFGVEFSNKDYKQLNIPNNSIIYCDIPYKGTKQYSTSKNFNHEDFWEWCRKKTKEGHQVFISEYNAPTDFECVWEMKVKSSLSANGKIGGSKNSVEKLFKYKL
jgi:DNA adenine methylase